MGIGAIVTRAIGARSRLDPIAPKSRSIVVGTILFMTR